MVRIITLLITLIIAIIIAELYFNFLSYSFNKLRYLTLYDGGKSCIKELKNYSKNFESLGSFKKVNVGLTMRLELNHIIILNFRVI